MGYMCYRCYNRCYNTICKQTLHWIIGLAANLLGLSL